MPRIASSTLIGVLALSLLALAGCGSSSSTTTTTANSPTPQQEAAVKAAAAAVKAAEAKAPKGASPVLRQIYRQFPAPKANRQEKSSAAVIKAGEKACRGKTPLQVKEEFFAAAKPKLEPEQTKMIVRVGSYEAKAAQDSSFVAGQLAADTYAATLPEAASQAGYQGCVYSLAQGLEKRLAPKKK